jgi:thioredoxin:protein disulfide reductase
VPSVFFRVLRGSAFVVGLASAFSASAAAQQVRRPRAEVTPVVEVPHAHAGDSIRLALRVSLPEGLHTQSNKPRDPTLIPTELTIDSGQSVAGPLPVPGVRIDEIVWPPTTDLTQQGQTQPLAVFERDFYIGVRATLGSGTPTGELKIPAHLRYQACDANLCYAPATANVEWALTILPATQPRPTYDLAALPTAVFTAIKWGTGEKPAAPTTNAERRTTNGGESGLAKLENFAVLGTTGGYLGTSEFLTFIRNAENGVQQRGMFEGRGPLAILLLVFLGGLALNLTPCVLPMIPINLAIIGAGSQSRRADGSPDRARGFLLGATYGAAMAVVYGGLGLIVVLTAGTFGTINSTWWFNLGIAILFVVLALAMFDVIIIDFSSFSSGFTPGKNSGTFLMAFAMGGVAALLAGACVAPVVIQVVLFSSNLYATGTKIALALPFCLGVGMALPWPVAGAGLAALPKPGMWMVRVKQAFGVFILATAAYYGYEAYSIISNRWVDASAVTSSVEEQLKTGWHANLAEGLDTAAREGKPVLIDMWATWCKNCLTMDQTTLKNADVKSALDKYVKIKFQAEDPDSPPAKPVMQRFNAVGLPAYVILKPKG